MLRRFLAALLASATIALAAATPAHAALPICASNAICFAEGGISFQSYTGDIARNSCRSVQDNRTEYIDNETAVQWRVFTTTNCTGTVGVVYAHSSGTMSGIWWRSIGSTYRTSSA